MSHIVGDEETFLTIRLGQDLRDRLEHTAGLNDRSMSAEVRRAVRFYLDAINGEAADLNAPPSPVGGPERKEA